MIKFGLHWNADGNATSDDIAIFRRARSECALLLSSADTHEFGRIVDCGVSADSIIVRLWWQPSWSGDFVAHMVEQCAKFYNVGARLFQIHNEPNLSREGLGTHWKNGNEFGVLFATTAVVLRKKFSDARIGFPGLSPGADWQGVAENQHLSRQDAIKFILDARFHIEQQADFICAHSYWFSPDTMYHLHAGAHVQDVCRLFPALPVWLTEYSNNSPHVSRLEKAAQYVEYWKNLSNNHQIRGMMAFVVGGSNEYWRNVSNETWTHEMAEIVSSRQLPNQPNQPSLAQPIQPAQPAQPAQPVQPVQQVQQVQQVYTIQAGDNLTFVSQKFGCTVDSILSLNPTITNPNLIYVGQKINIPIPATYNALEPALETFRYPVAIRRITQYFGENKNRLFYGSAGHTGVDFGAAIGTPVLASFAGKVVYRAYGRTGYGVQVRIQNGEYLAIYGHLSFISASLGQNVHLGQIIGLSGNTGASTGPHLHFEIRKNGQAIDPLPLLTKI